MPWLCDRKSGKDCSPGELSAGMSSNFRLEFWIEDKSLLIECVKVFEVVSLAF